MESRARIVSEFFEFQKFRFGEACYFYHFVCFSPFVVFGVVPDAAL